MSVPVIYDKDMRRVVYLENAMTVSYEQPLNSLWTASFSLPIDDPKNEECLPFRFVELWDGDERIDLFRIMPTTAVRNAGKQTITYQCEHVLATLIDDVLFQYHQIGNLGVYTRDVLSYILSKQTVQRWQLGEVAFSRQFEYSWENESLLAALFSVPKPFTDEYMWTWDTSTYPWTLNLVKAPSEIDAYIRYGVNMQGIEKEIDPRQMANRIYGLGFGEGVNQLTFADINDGKPYVEDIESQQKYGLVATVFVDRRYQYPETLKARCEAILADIKEPRISYKVQAADISSLTDTPIYKFKTGGLVRIIDEELGEDIIARVVNKRKRDLYGQPGQVEMEIANKPLDIASSIADLSNRLRIEEVYAQGATNFDSHDYADNCDPDHPAVLRFWVPEDTARINKVMLSYRVEAFRAYSRAIEAAPATTSGPSSRTTSGPSSTETTGPSNVTTTGPSNRTTSGPSSTNTTGVAYWQLSPPQFLPADFMDTAGDPPHAHSMYSVQHYHGMDHTHNIEHTHDMPHVHYMPHTHDIDHTHVIPAHTHDIEHGIFEGPTPTAVTVRVDGNIVPGLGTSEDEVDIVPYLSKDGSGRIERGTWHTIEIAPNSLGRVVASVISQIFVQSRGGGNY